MTVLKTAKTVKKAKVSRTRCLANDQPALLKTLLRRSQASGTASLPLTNADSEATAATTAAATEAGSITSAAIAADIKAAIGVDSKAATAEVSRQASKTATAAAASNAEVTGEADDRSEAAGTNTSK